MRLIGGGYAIDGGGGGGYKINTGVYEINCYRVPMKLIQGRELRN